jgi:hypothetical protein
MHKRNMSVGCGPVLFGPAAADDWFKGFRPAAEIAKDGDDAVVRVELPGVDVEKDVNVEVRGALRLVPPVVPVAGGAQSVPPDS